MRPYLFLCIGLFSVFTALERSDALRIRSRRSGALAGFEDPYSLSGAYSALERQRRRLDLNDRLNTLYNPNDNQYFNLKYGPDIDQSDLSDILPGYYADNSDLDDTGYYPDSMFDNSYGARNEESFPYMPTGYDDSVYAPQKRTPYRPHRVSPSVDELRRMFGSASSPVKRIVPVRRRDFSKGLNADMEDSYSSEEIQNDVEQEGNDSEEESDTDSTIGTDTASLAEKMKELIDAAAKLSKAEIQEVENEATEDEPSEVVEEIEVAEMPPQEEDVHDELMKVFDDAETPDNAITVEEEVVDKNPDLEGVDIEDASDENQETNNDEVNRLVDTYISQAQRKAKRGVADGYIDPLDTQTLVNEIDDLKEDVESLELLQVLSNKENDYLANALKYATLDQLDDKREYVANEYKDISKATETEELIQLLSSKLGEDTDEVEAKEMLGDYLDNQGNTDSLQTPAQGQWYNEPVDDNVGDALQDDSDDVNDVDITALEPYGSELPIDIPYPDEDDEDTEEDFDENEDNMILGDEDVKGHLLQQVLGGMSPEEVRNLLTQAQLDAEDDQGVCPEVMELSDGCAFADAFAIPIDEEARKLCVRHEMCYTCGRTVGLSGPACDQGYRSMVDEACMGDNRCLRNALQFLKLMSAYHTYQPFSPQPCRAPCIEQTIYGVP